MLCLRGNRVRTCEGVTRRDWLRVGSVAGLSLPGLWAAKAHATDAQRGPAFGRAKSAIVCFLFGAPPHQDLWDLKPLAPADVRGEYKPIETRCPGMSISEVLPKTAAITDRLALVRSVHHPDNTHTVAMHYMLTGRRHLRPETNPQNEPTDFPTFGAVMQYLRRGTARLPSGVSLNSPANQVSANNHIFPGFFAGWLGATYDPLFVSQDPTLDTFSPLPVVESEALGRYASRRSLLDEVDSHRMKLSELAGREGFGDAYDRAFDLVTSTAARRAFDLGQENADTRQRYGASAFGQGCLLARRLVEAGVSLVTVNWARDDAFWDTHADNFGRLKTLVPPFDAGFSALIEDLDQRGMLDETLVVCLGEFGRTPKINSQAGRDHWADCNSVVLAGGGIRGGQVFGSSDRLAAYPASMPVLPEDISAMLYHALGVDPSYEIVDPLGRPFALSTGRPLLELT